MPERRVFISHHGADREHAEELAAILEGQGVAVWLSGRDTRPGLDYSEQLDDAISHCIGFVILYTEKASSDRDVRAQMHMAFSLGKPIFPVRFDDVEASRGLRLFLAAAPWTDAFGLHRQQNLNRLVEALISVDAAVSKATPWKQRAVASPQHSELKESDKKSTVALGPQRVQPREWRSVSVIGLSSSLITIITFVVANSSSLGGLILEVWPWLLAGLMILLVGYFIRSAFAARSMSFALTDFAYTFPWIGKLRRYANDSARFDPARGWFPQEEALCRDYARHLVSLSREVFWQRTTYLRKALDMGRRPLPRYAILLLILLVSLESVGAAYLIGAAADIEATQERSMLMVGIIAVLASLLVWVVHAAGQQLYRTSVIRNCFRMFQAMRGPYFSSRIVGLADDQRIDDEEPAYVQCTNRTLKQPGDLGSYAWVWLSTLLLVLVATALTILRLRTLQQESALHSLFPDANVSGLLVASADTAALTGFAVFGTIFITTHLVALAMGFRYGFAGRQSFEAYFETQGHFDFASYNREIRRRAKIAESRLERLRRLMEQRSPQPIAWQKSFFDFLREERRTGLTELADPAEL